MASLGQFDRWAHRAHAEAAPQPNVTTAVLRRLRETEPEAAQPGLWLWLLSGVSACAALICAALGYGAWVALTEPWPSWLHDLSNWGWL